MMSYESFVEVDPREVSVDYDKVVLDLKANEVFKGRYAVFQGGKIDPPPDRDGGGPPPEAGGRPPQRAALTHAGA